MKRFVPLLTFLAALFLLTACSKKRPGSTRVLVFAKTAGFHHDCIPNANDAIIKLGKENGFTVDTTTNPAYFTEDSLKNYSAVIFNNTTGDVLDYRQEAAFERYIQAGGGYVGLHSASDTEYDWGWYGRLVGGYFYDHPGINDTFPNVQPGTFNVVDKNNAITKGLPDPWKRTDEFYNFKKFSKDVKVLITLDEKSYNGGNMGDFHPMTWYHEFDGGRAFYTNMGHTKETYTEPDYLKMLLAGIKYAIGDNKALDYSKSKTQLPPLEERFTKTILAEGEFFEPTEMTILPDFDILVAQRRGELMLYKNATKSVKQAGFLNVYWKTNTPGVNAEEGFMGLAKDPNFEKNNWIYIYYAPIDSSVNRLSRFTFKNDTLDLSTEVKILDVRSTREICCHTGGSIAFGPDGLLYLSTGDNATPFDEPNARYVNSGFAPLNDLPGKEQYDARRSAGNANDLRGKILRIKVNDDGSYTVPDGNLFPKNSDSARAEIYVMGNRNPYRISVDQKNSYLYWGEVGPDAGNDSLKTRGPRGYDEVNQAKKAGFFGWPYFIGPNLPYYEFDYTTGKTGIKFDPQHPVNNSRNNTGLHNLPAAQPAMIWYPYATSSDFPQVGTGGRNAMAGPAYYTDMFPKETRLPDYYNNKVIIYEWMRGWMKAVTLDKNGDFDKMEPFAPLVKLNNCIDMEVGPDGKIYLLEYGTGWFTKNDNSALARIDYTAGNITPVITSLTTDKAAGKLPFTINATAEAIDPDKGTLTYVWDFGDGTKKETKEPTATHTYNKQGEFKISVEAKDNEGGLAKGSTTQIYAGNETPVVTVNITSGNPSFYIPGSSVNYNVQIKDNDDPSPIDPNNLFVEADFVEGYDLAGKQQGHQQAAAEVNGKGLTLSLDCKACHKEDSKSVGPAYIDVSKKYLNDSEAPKYLANKIRKGGSGVWGEVAMAAHPDITDKDLSEITQYILSLAKKNVSKKSLPATGSVPVPANAKPGSTLVITARYTDKGTNGSKPLTGFGSTVLRSNSVSLTGQEKNKGFSSVNVNGNTFVLIPNSDGWIALEKISLAGVKNLIVTTGWQVAPASPVKFELRLDAPDGELVGTGKLEPAKAKGNTATFIIPLKQVTDGKEHTIYIVTTPDTPGVNQALGLASLVFSAK